MTSDDELLDNIVSIATAGAVQAGAQVHNVVTLAPRGMKKVRQLDNAQLSHELAAINSVYHALGPERTQDFLTREGRELHQRLLAIPEVACFREMLSAYREELGDAKKREALMNQTVKPDPPSIQRQRLQEDGGDDVA